MHGLDKAVLQCLWYSKRQKSSHSVCVQQSFKKFYYIQNHENSTLDTSVAMVSHSNLKYAHTVERIPFP